MGIPMFRESTSVEASKTHPIKDPCAAARSAIRRQPTIRRPTRQTGSALRSATLRSPFPRPLTDELAREAGLSRHVRSPVSNSAPGDDPFDLTAGLTDSNQSTGQRLLSEVLRHSRPGHRLRIPRSTALPDLHRRSSPGDDASQRPDRDPPSFTPRFAPAYSYPRQTSSPYPEAAPPYLPPIRLPRGPEYPSAESTVPLLRRVGQRSINDATGSNRESTIDGLGDRQRSVSPDEDHANDAWETLLTTITPDANLPSADSSFTSASASGTNSSMNGTTRSSATSFGPPQSQELGPATVQMVLDPYPEFLNPCDYPSSSDSDSDSELGLGRQISLFRRQQRMRQMDSLRRSQNLSAPSNHPPVPTLSFSFSDSSTDPDLHQMQAILDRLSRREDIPDDWWAAAGLSRSLGHRVAPGAGVPDGPSDPDRADAGRG